MNRSDYVLAVDGGGTRCRVALVAGASRHQVETGSANASTDLDGCAAEIRKGLLQIAEQTGLVAEELYKCPSYLGIAGVIGPEIAEALTQKLPLTKLRIEDDRPAAVRGALGNKDGALIHCGTGSFQAIQDGGRIRLVGGWGPQLGDEGSAQWLGRKALSAALCAYDGTAESSDLTDAILTQFGSPMAIVRYTAQASPNQIGQMAKLVSEKRASDPVARNLLTKGATKLVRPLREIGWTPGAPLCLTGGLGPVYREFLPQDTQRSIIPAQADPIDGAIALARDFQAELAN